MIVFVILPISIYSAQVTFLGKRATITIAHLFRESCHSKSLIPKPNGKPRPKKATNKKKKIKKIKNPKIQNPKIQTSNTFEENWAPAKNCGFLNFWILAYHIISTKCNILTVLTVLVQY